jgi:hypothetical protein
MVTDWTDTMPGLISTSRRFAQTIEEVTKGRIKMESRFCRPRVNQPVNRRD